jgi:hypothetical protein
MIPIKYVEEWMFWILFCVFILCIALLLSSCSPQVPKVLEVPMLVKPHVIINPKPNLPISGITPQSTYQDISKSYVATVKIQDDYENYLLSLLK